MTSSVQLKMTDYDWKQTLQSYLVEVEKECFYFVKNSHGSEKCLRVREETMNLKKWSGEQDQSPVLAWPGRPPAMFYCSTWRPTWNLENLIIDWHGPYDGLIFIDWSSPFQILPEGKRRRASVRHRAATAQVMWLGSIHTTAACPVVPTRIVSRQRVGPLSRSPEGWG